MTDFPPWEPPFAGDETGALFGALDRLRATFRWKCADLDAAGLAARSTTSSLTIGGLLKHLALQEDYCFQVKVLGAPMPGPWDLSKWDTEGDAGSSNRRTRHARTALRALGPSVARSRAVAAAREPRVAWRAGAQTLSDGTIRRPPRVLDLVEEYACTRARGHPA